MPTTGGLVSRFGRRSVFAGFAVVLCATAPLLAWAPGLPGFVVALAMFGAFAGALDVALNAEAVDVEAPPRPLRAQRHACGVEPRCLRRHRRRRRRGQAHLSPGWSLLAVGAGVLVALLACARRFATTRAAQPGPAFALPTRRTLVIGVVVFCSLFVESAVADWSAVYLHSVVGTSLSVAALGFTVFSVAMVTGRLSGDWLVNRLGPVRTARVPAVAGALALAMGLAAGGRTGALVGFAIAGMGTAVLFPLGMTAAAARTADPATGVAAAATVGYIGWLVAPGVIGALAATTSLAAALGVAAGMSGWPRRSPARWAGTAPPMSRHAADDLGPAHRDGQELARKFPNRRDPPCRASRPPRGPDRPASHAPPGGQPRARRVPRRPPARR